MPLSAYGGGSLPPGKALHGTPTGKDSNFPPPQQRRCSFNSQGESTHLMWARQAVRDTASQLQGVNKLTLTQGITNTQ